MSQIQLETIIESDIQLVFDLSRSVNLHEISTSQTKEKAVAGKTSGLLGKGDCVTWRAKHFVFFQHLSIEITEFDSPVFFEDTMTKGIFKYFCHKHYFETKENKVIVKETIEFSSPLGILGKFVDFVYLKKYMKNFIIERNKAIKEYAESDQWKGIIFDTNE